MSNKSITGNSACIARHNNYCVTPPKVCRVKGHNVTIARAAAKLERDEDLGSSVSRATSVRMRHMLR